MREPMSSEMVNESGSGAQTGHAPQTSALPVPRVSFLTRFEVDPEHVISSMDAAGDDPARQAPSFAIPIEKVGVDRHHVPIRLGPFLGSTEVRTLQCLVRIRTGLPATHRGIHVSRLGDVVAELCTRTFSDLVEYARTCAALIGEQQYRGPTEVEVEGHLATVTPVRGGREGNPKRSLDTIGVFASSRWPAEMAAHKTGLQIHHIIACPCAQQTMKHTTRHSPRYPELPADQPPFLTHSQRCRTRVEVSSGDELPLLERMLEAVERVVFRTRSTLPREHELLLVHESHRRPQFLEDVLRDVAMALAEVCRGLDPDSVIAISSASFESIHEYDLHGRLVRTLGELHAVAGSR